MPNEFPSIFSLAIWPSKLCHVVRFCINHSSLLEEEDNVVSINAIFLLFDFLVKPKSS